MFVIFLLGALACGQLGLDGGAANAKKRVEFVLQVLKEGAPENGTRFQTAICRWEQDVVLIPDRDMLGIASDAFDQWRREGEIYGSVKDFTIADEVDVAGEGDPAGTFYVDVTINGEQHWIRVPPKARISWADAE